MGSDQMNVTLMAMAVRFAFAPPADPSYSWAIEPAFIANTHGWPHGIPGNPFLSRGPLRIPK